MIGPDAARYLAIANRVKVPRPFCLRWLLPRLCGLDRWRWWAAWFLSWPVLALGMLSLARSTGSGWPQAFAGVALLLGLPGILGPGVSIPVGVDMPATALSACAAAGFAQGSVWSVAAAVLLVCTAAAIKETAPVWVALWAWSPLALVGLAVVAARVVWVGLRHLEGVDPLGPEFQQIADHPFRAGIAAHRDRARDAWLHVAPWGACLAALWRPDWRLGVVLAAAMLQLVVATDTVRLVHHAAGPALALAAARNIPTAWLLLAVVAHTFWWRNAERV